MCKYIFFFNVILTLFIHLFVDTVNISISTIILFIGIYICVCVYVYYTYTHTQIYMPIKKIQFDR